MDTTVSSVLSAIPNLILRTPLRKLLSALADRNSSRMLSTAGLVIKAGGGVLAKTGAAACHLVVDGQLATIGAAIDMPALSGTVTNAKFNVFVFYQDSAGVRTTVMGTEAATLGAVKFPDTPVKKAMIGFIVINPTGAGNFVGNTTALDDAGVVPNAVFLSVLSGADPNMLLG